VLNQAKITTDVDGVDYDAVMLDFNGETSPVIQFSLPAYANEAQRIANEQARIAAEQQRIVNEEERIAAETIRQQNEAQRINNEAQRIAEFEQIKEDAIEATDAANSAADLANEKAQLAADKAALAQAAANLANAKAQLADKKAVLAQAAAMLANDKADLAQQKAEYAQTQGDYAKTQGDYAKEQGEIAEEDHERAEADHTRAESDHTQAGTDHSTAVNDHTQSVTDHTQADTDHTQATSDHTQAGNDHTRAESDHGIAADDHTQAGNDHTRAESDHTRAESDHAAVEVYVDSLGAFDISAYHATGGVLAEYADLTAALGTNGANIPDALRKGGMSVKFVQSFDNKYVQYRLMSDSFNTTPANWQSENVDDEPTVESHNLVESEGVLVSNWNNTTGAVYTKAIINSGVWGLGTNRLGLIIPCIEGSELYIKANSNYNAYYAFLVSKGIKEGDSVDFVSGTTETPITAGRILKTTIPTGTNYLYIRLQASNAGAVYTPEAIKINGVNCLKDITNSLSNLVVNNKKIMDSVLPVSERTIIYGTLGTSSPLTWNISNTTDDKYVLVKVQGGVTAQIQASNTSCVGCFLKTLPTLFSNGLDLTSYLATGSGRTVWTSTSPAFTIPSDATYLLVSLSVNNNDWSPSKVIINNYDYTKDIQKNIEDTRSSLKAGIDTNSNNIEKIKHIISSTRFDVDEIYMSPDFYTSANVASIAKYQFYIGFLSSSQYIVGLILRDSSNATVADGRIYCSTEAEATALLNSGFIDLPSLKYKFTLKISGSASPSGDVILTNDVLDISKQKQINLMLVNQVVNKEKKVIPTLTTGKYINTFGVEQSSSAMSYTDDIELKTGETIKLYCFSFTSASALCLHNSNGTYTPLIAGKTNSNYLYEYTATEDCKVVASLRHGSYYSISVVTDDTYTITPRLTWTGSRYILFDSPSIVGSSNANFGISNIVKVYKDDVLTIKIAGSANLNAVLTMVDKNMLILNPVILCTSASYIEYSYKVLETGYAVLSGNYGTYTPPSLVIKRKLDYVVFDETADSVFADKGAKEKDYYVDDAEIIPENYGTILTYEGDNKVSSNHIVNAVSYPNGEIIACRSNGKVVKIDKDGNETDLLTLTGSNMDWRGMYIDSNLNVYVSPHATMGSMQMSDRGLYRLAYGESSFVKVISLYDTSSSVESETESNDDTIWTMCEDNKGNLYAGVYAHSVRANTSIYKSTDKGVTWTVVSDLITDGFVPVSSQWGTAMHIHCIIFNPYDQNLYCIVGEVNTIFKSADGGVTWTDMKVRCGVAKGTCLIAVPDGILSGSDGAYTGDITKIYADGKTAKSVGRMWHAEFFGLRRSDVTGWLYAFTKIESNIGTTVKYPPIEANTSAEALNTWKNTTGNQVATWQLYNDWVSAHYTHDSIHPTNAAILVSRDNGESWEVIYKKDTNTGSGLGCGIFCVGYFMNGECLCGMAIEE
jgi:hypothetical protein